MARWSLVVSLMVPLGLAACTAHSAPDPAGLEAAAAARIQAIPAADPSKSGDARVTKSWKNPYLILHPDELTRKLAQLPDSAWPYGRVVAVTESTANGSDRDKAEIRKNKAIVAGTLEGMHVAINWIPAT